MNESEDIIDKTLDFWQPRSPDKLTREDSSQIIENASGFFSVLMEWEAKDKETTQEP